MTDQNPAAPLLGSFLAGADASSRSAFSWLLLLLLMMICWSLSVQVVMWCEHSPSHTLTHTQSSNSCSTPVSVRHC